MSLSKPIPAEIKEKLSNDPFMKECCIASNECEGRIEWHHNLIYGGKRQNEWWSILPVCHFHHMKESQYKSKLNDVMCNRASYDELMPFCKAINYMAIKAELDYA